MLISLGLFVLWSVFCLVLFPFWKTLPFDLLKWIADACGWIYPGLLALFAVSSGVVVDGFAQHRIKREDKEEEK